MATRTGFFKVVPDYVNAVQAEVDAVEGVVATKASITALDAVVADVGTKAPLTQVVSLENVVVGHTASLAVKVEQSHIDTAVSNLVNGAGASLDTLKELADALGNDANLASTLTAQIALKADASALSALEGTVAGLPDLAYVDGAVAGIQATLAQKVDTLTFEDLSAVVDTQSGLIDAVDEMANILVGANGALWVETAPGTNTQYTYNGIKQF